MNGAGDVVSIISQKMLWRSKTVPGNDKNVSVDNGFQRRPTVRLSRQAWREVFPEENGI